MGIGENDWDNFSNHLGATLEHFQVPEKEKNEVFGFVDSLKKEIVE
jgi:hypothetical protein